MDIQYSEWIRRFRFFLILVFALGVLACPAGSKADTGGSSDAEREESVQNGIVKERAQNGVVKVRITFRANDKDENHKVVRYQTGFMIGDGTQTTHVVTAYAGLHASSGEKDQWRSGWVDDQGKLPEIGAPTVEIIQNWDVIVTGNIVSESERAGVSIVSLSGNKSADLSLVLADGNTVPEGSVYLCTFPDTEGEKLAFSEQSVYFMKGSFLQMYGQGDEALLEYDIHPDLSQAAGSPVLDKTGSVIGMHTGINENGNGSAVGIGAVRKLLDQNKVNYLSYHEAAAKKKKSVLPIVLGVIAGILLVLSVIQIIRGFSGKKKYDLENPERMPRLMRVSSGETIPIAKVPFCLGSSMEGTDYSIPGNRRVSRKHALIVGGPLQFMLVDLSSSNGTSLNGEWLQPEAQYQIRHGDRIWLADEEFIFLQG